MPEIEERQAKIEGILEQLDKRVGRLEVQLEGLRTEIKDLRTDFKTDMENLRTELKAEMDNLRSEFRTDIVRLETDIKTNFRWTVGMWITVMLGILALFFKIP